MTIETLKAYQVGDNDIVAAYDQVGAIKVLCIFCSYPDDEYGLDEVQLVENEVQDATEANDQNEVATVTLEKTLRQELSELTEPAYLSRPAIILARCAAGGWTVNSAALPVEPMLKLVDWPGMSTGAGVVQLRNPGKMWTSCVSKAGPIHYLQP
ncbi:hypothetical protein JET89_15910 [Pseudomonas aeruginosa]|uniref:Uncharacterized protein n=1 Tax=Stutzerimonas azotifigens TaxID=291995 RepID=A0ABR5Z6R7_9GAMM|nr:MULTISPECIES: hypothetical protein [Pseudomonadaceae]EJQ7926824.1 hypothetical protein [Pseudomonas aeruginosa]EKW6758264.1 hypothetical protein [Pseudomonas aeruginosa]EKY2867451.1 hypothetical protein [Pseudomonas aeruginosa]MBA1275821.1 hypothetical protein [Stutzerimonas azotifigens]MBG6509475.1 hypothetical protein [Pseudomonas aeruginosa]